MQPACMFSYTMCPFRYIVLHHITLQCFCSSLCLLQADENKLNKPVHMPMQHMMSTVMTIWNSFKNCCEKPSREVHTRSLTWSSQHTHHSIPISIPNSDRLYCSYAQYACPKFHYSTWHACIHTCWTWCAIIYMHAVLKSLHFRWLKTNATWMSLQAQVCTLPTPVQLALHFLTSCVLHIQGSVVSHSVLRCNAIAHVHPFLV